MKIKDKSFKVLIDHEQISKRVADLAEAINRDYEGKNPLFIAIMNGAFMFAAELNEARACTLRNNVYKS